FLGYQLYQAEKAGLALEVGRNKMDSMFDSKLQYDSYFNGLHIIYKYNQPGLFNFAMHGGPHVVNSDKNHYGWIAEGKWSEIMDSPVFLTYSFTDWNAPKNKKCGDDCHCPVWDENYLFTISQMIAGIKIYNTTVYGAYLLNHQQSEHNDGFYVGFTTGQIY